MKSRYFYTLVFFIFLGSVASYAADDGAATASPSGRVKVSYSHASPRTVGLSEPLSRELRRVAHAGSLLCENMPPSLFILFSPPYNMSENNFSSSAVPQPFKDFKQARDFFKEEGRRLKAAEAEERTKIQSQFNNSMPKKIDVRPPDKNYAFVRLIFESKGEIIGHYGLVKRGEGYKFEPVKSDTYTTDDSEIVFLSGNLEGGANSPPFSFIPTVGTNNIPYLLCQKQTHRDEDYKKKFARKYVDMYSEDPESLFQKLLQGREELKGLVGDYKRSEDELLLIDIYKKLNEQDTKIPGSKTELSFADQVNAFFCSEEAMSEFLSCANIVYPQFPAHSKVHIVLFSKWTPCIACAARLDGIASPITEYIKSQDLDIQKYFLAYEPYSSFNRGFANSSRHNDGDWKLMMSKSLLAEKSKAITFALSARKNEGEANQSTVQRTPTKPPLNTTNLTPDATPSRHLVFVSPGTVQDVMVREDDVSAEKMRQAEERRQQAEIQREQANRRKKQDSDLARMSGRYRGQQGSLKQKRGGYASAAAADNDAGDHVASAAAAEENPPQDKVQVRNGKAMPQQNSEAVRVIDFGADNEE